jgi:hypothetical protein
MMKKKKKPTKEFKSLGKKNGYQTKNIIHTINPKPLIKIPKETQSHNNTLKKKIQILKKQLKKKERAKKFTSRLWWDNES